MLTEKPWRAEAIVRLLAAIFICTMLGSLGLTVIRFDAASTTTSANVFYLEVAGAALALGGALTAIAKPWTLERLKLRAVGLIACSYAGLALTGLAQKSGPTTGSTATVAAMIIAMLSFQGVALLLLWVFTRQHGVTVRESFGFANNTSSALMLGLVAGVLFVPVGLGLQAIVGLAAKRWFDIELAAQDAVTILQMASSWPVRAVLGVFAVVIAPLAEEGLFRGIFYPAVRRLGFPNGAMWITSLVFALIHFNLLSFIPLVVLAIMLVKLYEKTGNLLACVACHGTFNAINFVLLFVFKDYGGKLGS